MPTGFLFKTSFLFLKNLEYLFTCQFHSSVDQGHREATMVAAVICQMTVKTLVIFFVALRNIFTHIHTPSTLIKSPPEAYHLVSPIWKHSVGDYAVLSSDTVHSPLFDWNWKRTASTRKNTGWNFLWSMWEQDDKFNKPSKWFCRAL